MRNSIQIASASLLDLDAIVEIENICFEADRFSRKQFAYLIAKSRGGFYVAREGAKTVGYLSLLSRKNDGNLRIYGIAVHPAARGRNIAVMFIEKAKEHASTNGQEIISLEVKTTNTPALKLYEKTGFKTVSVKKAYYEDGADAFRMELSLTGKV